MIFKTICLLILPMLCFGLAQSLNDGASFVDVEPDLGRLQRNLLQTNGEVKDAPLTEAPVQHEATEAPKKGKFQPGEYLLGPKIFYDGGHFAMELGSPIRVTIFDGEDPTKKLSTVKLDDPAMSVKGSMINADKTDFKVNLDWKQQNFGSDLKISSIQINMYFKRKGNDEFYMYNLDVVKLVIGSRHLNNNVLEVEDKDGYKIAAPIGSSFTCSDLGMFKPAKNESATYKIGVTFPDMQLQAFNVKHKFGPEWDCSNMMPVGLLVGLVVTLFFALICYWGFSMLASIQTMDRFDDPKGKQIYVPQTD